METVTERSVIEFFITKPNVKGTVKKVIDDETFVTVAYNSSKRFPSFCKVVDDRPSSPTKGREVLVRYSENESSIWVDEQYEKFDLQKYKMGEVRCTPIYFLDGRLRVDPNNETLLEYLRKCRFNQKNADRYNFRDKTFFEFNPEEVAQNQIANTEREFKLEKKAREVHFDKAQAIARVSGEVKHFNEMKELTPPEVRWYLIRLAKKDPETFDAVYEDNYLEAKYDILTAIDTGVLMWAGQQRDILADGRTGDVICKAEIGADKLTFCAGYLLENALETYSAIRRKLGRGDVTESLGASNLEDPQDLIANGTTAQLVDEFIRWHKDKENGQPLFDPVKGQDIRFNGIVLLDPTGEGKRGYEGAKRFLNDEGNKVVFKSVLEKYVSQVNSK